MGYETMFDFSGDEVVFLVFSGILAIWGLVFFYAPLVTMPALGRSALCRACLCLLPVVLAAFTSFVLYRWSDPQVAGHVDYMLLFIAGNLAWMTLVWAFMPLMGINLRQDAIDRNNPAAVAAACGAVCGASIIYALANVGGGPTIWTSIAPAFAGTAAWAVIWRMMEFLGGDVAEAVTIDRDSASGLRLGGALLGCGIIVGRAAGGSWISWDQTWADMVRFGWPAMGLGVIAGLIHRACRPTSANPTPDVITGGWVYAGGFVAVAVIVVALTPQGLHPSKW